MRIATWNIKQAVAPRKPLEELWQWAHEVVHADIMVFTEAKVPKDGVPDGWNAVWKQGAIGGKRPWGTVIAARGYELKDITNGVEGPGGFSISHTWPGAVTIVDVLQNGKVIGTIAGIYGITQDEEGNSIGSGDVSAPIILEELADLMRSPRGKRLVFAGDFNLWPARMPDDLYRKMIDVVERTAKTRPKLQGCSGCSTDTSLCGHMWTHKNGSKDGLNAKVQNLDYIFVAKKLKRKIKTVTGGIADFPDSWDHSDHAPVVADLKL